MFPEFVNATTSTAKDQPCFVPFVARPRADEDCIFTINTPDVPTGPMISNTHVFNACEAASLEPPFRVNRLNDNIYSVTFQNPESAREARGESIRLPSAIPGSPDLYVKASFHLRCPPIAFVCDVGTLSIDHATLPSRVAHALRGSRLPWALYMNESADAAGTRRRYVLRFPGSSPQPGVQRLFFPLDAQHGGDLVWGVFSPIDPSDGLYCVRYCDTSEKVHCPLGRLLINSNRE